jgi:tRNA G18 (ribose-2'-O)-methylase SpoU
MVVIAHNIRSLHNVGSIFRSADCFGVERLYLTGFTGTPPRPEIAKVALGAEDRVLWTHCPDPLAVIRDLKRAGYLVVAIETGPRSEYLKYPDRDKVCLVVGNEVVGIESEVLTECDRVMEIPMPGRKRSLNVSVAAGIAMFVCSAKKG